MVLRHGRLLRRAERARHHDGRRLRNHPGSACGDGPRTTRSDPVFRSAAFPRRRVLALQASRWFKTLFFRAAAFNLIARMARRFAAHAGGDLKPSDAVHARAAMVRHLAWPRTARFAAAPP